MKEGYLLKRMPVVDDTAKIAAFISSDRAKILTGVIINASSGEVLDWLIMYQHPALFFIDVPKIMLAAHIVVNLVR
jgi:hypothetical protein